jgi:MoaA/NifB/PqqE/SkfB family radical SAM enzyme
MINALLKYLALLMKSCIKDSLEPIVFVTNSCNLSCEHCFYSTQLNKNNEELTVECFRKLASSLPPTCKKIILTGGEPFMREDILDIIRAFMDYGIKNFTINTNGTLNERISKFIDSIANIEGVDIFITVSLDGPEETHDNIRKQRGAFYKTVETLRILKEKNIAFGVQTVLSSSNYQKINVFDKFIYDNFKIDVHYQFVRGASISGLSYGHKNIFEPFKKLLLPSHNDVKMFLEKLGEIYKSRIKRSNNLYKNIFDFTVLECKYLIIKKRKKLFPCLAGENRCVIYPSSEVAICEYMVPVKTNLKQADYNFAAIWNSHEIAAQRKIAKHCFCTQGCFINITATLRFLVYFMKNLIIYSVSGGKKLGEPLF